MGKIKASRHIMARYMLQDTFKGQIQVIIFIQGQLQVLIFVQGQLQVSIHTRGQIYGSIQIYPKVDIGSNIFIQGQIQVSIHTQGQIYGSIYIYPGVNVGSNIQGLIYIQEEIYYTNQDVHALTQKLSSIFPITTFKIKIETSVLHFENFYVQGYKKKYK